MQHATRPNVRTSINMIKTRLENILKKREEKGLLRRLIVNRGVDFVSNDYLGMARNHTVHSEFLRRLSLETGGIEGEDVALMGSTGSRLLAGHGSECESLEQFLAQFHNAEAALLFNSGFDANAGFFACVPQPGDAILYDQLIHASVHDGLKSTRASVKKSFAHNSPSDLLVALKEVKNANHVFVSVESLYSMDGDLAPLVEFLQVMHEFPNSHLIVDEAHATGVYGPEGRGWVAHLGLESRVFARLHTFGKALGGHGACIVGPRVLCDYLVNYCRPLIYSTALPRHSLIATRCSYDYLSSNADDMQKVLFRLIDEFYVGMSRQLQRCNARDISLLESKSPVQGVIVPGNAVVSNLASYLQSHGFNVRPIRSPTVPAGKERIRVCIHAHNTIQEVQGLVAAIGSWIDQVYQMGEYGGATFASKQSKLSRL
jgi:8-amino-7-oxononanoate synthase